MIKSIYFTAFQEFGGIETYSLNLASKWISGGDSVELVCVSAHSAFRRRAVRLGVPVKTLAEASKEVDELYLMSFLDERRPPVRAGRIVQVVNGNLSQLTGRKYAVPDDVDEFWCVSQTTLECFYEALQPDSLVRVPVKIVEPVTDAQDVVRRRRRRKGQRWRLVSFTRLSSEKGLESMKRLAEYLSRFGVDFTWHVYTRRESRLMVEAAGMVYHDSVDSPTSVMADYDAVVQLSDSEAYGYTIAEALAAGMPTVVSSFRGHDRFPDAVAVNLRSEPSILSLLRGFFKADAPAPSLARVETVRGFIDMRAGNRARRVGQIFLCEEERASELADKGFVRKVV